VLAAGRLDAGEDDRLGHPAEPIAGAGTGDPSPEQTAA
jgi:hypothetical protein